MKAFVSYSLNDNDELIMGILSSKLREKGFSIDISSDFYATTLNELTLLRINRVSLFVGVITGNSTHVERVYQEWNYAQQCRIPSILLVEGNIQMNGLIHSAIQGKYISFDRKNPKIAISQIETFRSNVSVETALPWILGGAALLAVINVLASNRR